MGVKLRWKTPDSESGYDTVYIVRAESETGEYSALANQAVEDNTYYDETGSDSYWYKVRFYDSVEAVYSEYSSPIQGGDTLGYVSVDDVRNLLRINESEYNDNQVQQFIDMATKKIDRLTGRTWQAETTVSNLYFDGNGKTYIDIPGYIEIQSLTAMAIRKDGSADFTTVTAAYVHVYESGRLALDNEAYPSVEVTSFPKGFKNVRISFTYGNSIPTDEIKELTLLMVSQTLSPDADRKIEIDKMIKELGSAGLIFP